MKDKRTSRIYTLKYSAIQGCYWPICCGIISFLSVFLLSKGFTNSQIGLILALANIFAVFLQPILATYADTTTRISLKNIIVVVSVISMVGSAIICFVPLSALVLSILLVFIITLIFTLQPLTNALGMNMVNSGTSLNFGLARGIGSISFAGVSYLLGVAVDRFGPSSPQKFSLIMLVFFIFFTFTFSRSQKKVTVTPAKDRATDEKAHSIFGFIKTYKKFMLLLLAASLTFTSHMMINNYITQITESIGGTTENMGTAIALAAAVELPAMALFTLIARKIRCSTILKLSFLFFALKALLILIAPNILMLYVSQFMQFPSYAFFIPASIYYVNQEIREADHVKGQAFMTVAITLGGVFASLFGGLLLDGPGVKAMLIAGFLSCLAGAVLCFPAISKTDYQNSTL